jgi:hypothetical protein
LSHLPRLQLIEIHEQRWCPVPVRDGTTAVLNAIATFARQYDRTAPLLRRAIVQSGAHRVVDLCAGAGGPWTRLTPRLADVVDEVLLTDLFPNVQTDHRATAGLRLDTWPDPVDATAVPPSLDGFRTLFTAFHHFPPVQAQALLQDAVDQGQGIALFEQTRRTLPALAVMLALPFLALLLTPFIRPWRPARFLWTYLLPAIPLVLLFDGLVSCLRTYTQAELHTLIARLTPAPNRPPYRWEVGRVSSLLSPLGVTYAIGVPAPVRGKPDTREQGSGVYELSGTGPRVARTK